MRRFLVKLLSICVCVSVFCCCFSCSGKQSAESAKPEAEESFIGERYTLNVKYHALSDNVSQMIFDTQMGFSAYKETRANYVFKGLEYCGVFYEYDSVSNTYGTLGNEIQFQSEKVIDATAVWECIYPSTILFDFLFVAEYNYNGDDGMWAVQGVKDGETEHSNMKVDDLSVDFEDKVGENFLDVNTDIFEYYVNKFTNIQTLNGDAVEFTNDMKIFIRVNGNTSEESLGYTYSSENGFTFADLLDYAEFLNKIGNISDITEIIVRFVYEVV